MQKRGKVFFGSAVALVTPFLNGEIDYESLGALIDYQIKGETDAIVVLGTTGEAPTISEEERNQVIEFSSKRIKGRALQYKYRRELFTQIDGFRRRICAESSSFFQCARSRTRCAKCNRCQDR